MHQPSLFADQPQPSDPSDTLASMKRSASLSPCRLYRYELWRVWGAGPFVMFIGLNPSTADETNDDPTIRRCVAFARAWGYSGLCMTNLFAFRATDPSDMRAAKDPIGPLNDLTLQTVASTASVVVAAWGAGGTHLARDREVRSAIPNLTYLRLTKDGHPGHPLYLPGNLLPRAWPI